MTREKKLRGKPYPKSTARSLIFVAVCILAPLFCFMALEFALRIGGYGYSPRFFVKQSIDGKDYFVRNFKFSWQFFPKPMARLATPLVIPLEKSPGTLRVFILGSSAAMGDPEPTFAFSRFLEVMLQTKYPERKIEVYNTAATAINSNVILPIARDCIGLQPDLFVIYCGNNEVIGPFGLSAALSPFFSSRQIIKAQVWLGQTKIGQLLKANARKNDPERDAWKGMELFLNNKISHRDPNLEKIYSHFGDNLAEICELAHKSGVKVALSSVIVNELDCAPFVSLHRPGLDEEKLRNFDSLLQQGSTFDSAGRVQQAAVAYAQAAEIDSEYAELQFKLGHCYLSINRTNEARECLQKALDYDALRFRADRRLNQEIQKVAARFADKGAMFVDAQAIARRESTAGLSGTNLLYEHVHLNFRGNYLLASSLLESTEKALALPHSQIQTLSLEECRKRLAFTLFDEKSIHEQLLTRFERAPFTSQCTHPQDLQILKSRIANLESDLKISTRTIDGEYQSAITANPNDWRMRMNYLKFLFEIKRYPEAHEQAKNIFGHIPFEYFSIENMGTTLQKLKKYDEAERYLQQAIDLNPFFAEAYEKMADLFEDQKNFEKAEESLKKTRSPDLLAFFYNRAGLYFGKQGQIDAANAYFNKALALNPNFAEARSNLVNSANLKAASAPQTSETSDIFNEANRLLKEGQFQKAVDLYTKVLSMNPNLPKAHNNAGVALIRLQRFDDALLHFKEAVRLMPDTLEAYPNIASILGMQGKHQEAVEILKQSIAIHPSAMLYRFLADECQKSGNIVEAEVYRQKASELPPKP